MAKTKVVIIYSPNVRQRRTVILPDDDSQVAAHAANLQPGEKALVGTLADYHAIGPDAMVTRLFSQPPSSHRCVVVDSFSRVIDVVMMDPQLDRHIRGRLVHDPLGLAKIGQSIIGLGLS